MNANLHERTAAVSQTSRSALRNEKRPSEFNASLNAELLRLVEDDTVAVQCSLQILDSSE